MSARDVVVRGHVQGVFFRDSCRDQAQAAGVTGWVSNESDGSVRAHFEGDPEAVERLVAWTRQGPSGAAVEHVDVTEANADGLTGFEVR